MDAPAPAAAGAISSANAAAIREESRAYLQSLLNKNLLVHTTDGRMFRGEFKCTDPVSHKETGRLGKPQEPILRQLPLDSLPSASICRN